jgi:hypothetical protein
MTNEIIAYDEFHERADAIAPTWIADLTDEQRDRIMSIAWEHCAWIAALTDQRIKEALEEAKALL